MEKMGWMLGGFLLVQALYHVIVVGLGYGGGLVTPELIAISRDAMWLLIVLVAVVSFAVVYPKAFRGFMRKRSGPFLLFAGLLFFACGVSYFSLDRNLNDILIGIKYGLWFLWIFFSATLLGAFFAQKKQIWMQLIVGIAWWLVGLLLLGRIRQFLKLFFFDWFLSFGYGELADFQFWVNPPIYYLTGFEGSLRRQGLFSGPNNYGYFLVAFLPFILQVFSSPLHTPFYQRKKTEFLSFFALLLWGLTIVATLSRAALLGTIVIIILMYGKQFRSVSKKRFLVFVGSVFCGAIVLSVRKRESTLMHIEKKFGALRYLIQQPMGYGLGSSGPAVYHSGNFLPENFYMQILLDIGLVGFVFFMLVLWVLAWRYWKLYLSVQDASFHAEHRVDQWSIGAVHSVLFSVFQSGGIGFVALLVIGLVLHVFEDSMVNYLFFVLRGITRGYLQALVDKKRNDKADFF